MRGGTVSPRYSCARGVCAIERDRWGERKRGREKTKAKTRKGTEERKKRRKEQGDKQNSPPPPKLEWCHRSCRKKAHLNGYATVRATVHEGRERERERDEDGDR